MDPEDFMGWAGGRMNDGQRAVVDSVFNSLDTREEGQLALDQVGNYSVLSVSETICFAVKGVFVVCLSV